MSRGLWYASFVLLIIGLIMLAAGRILAQYDQGKELLKGKVTAKVVSLEERETEGPFRSRYYPVFEYYAKGSLHKVTYPYGSYPCHFSPGQEVRLAYDPEDPTVYRILEQSPRRALPQILTVGGMALLILAVFIFLRFAARG